MAMLAGTATTTLAGHCCFYKVLATAVFFKAARVASIVPHPSLLSQGNGYHRTTTTVTILTTHITTTVTPAYICPKHGKTVARLCVTSLLVRTKQPRKSELRGYA